MKPLVLIVPVKTYNLTNARTHHMVRSRRVKEQRDAVTYALIGARWRELPRPTAETPWLVELVRIAPSNGLDDDGLVSALKCVRDAIAAFIAVDDKHRHIVRYAYDQRRGSDYAVEITVKRRNETSEAKAV